MPADDLLAGLSTGLGPRRPPVDPPRPPAVVWVRLLVLVAVVGGLVAAAVLALVAVGTTAMGTPTPAGGAAFPAHLGR